MNNPHNPLIPQGSFAEQKNQGRARVKIAVFFVLAVHGIGLLALLMQGCRRDDTDAVPPEVSSAVETNQVPPDFIPDQTNLVNDPFPALQADTNAPGLSATQTNPPPITPEIPPVLLPQTNAPAVGDSSLYIVQKGDSFSTIAKKAGVSTKALMAANPGVEPTKLKIDQKLVIPPPTPATTPSAPVPNTGTVSNGVQMHKVQSGETLSGIASKYKTTVKAIRSANNLKTDRIVVGQDLKIPVKSGSSTTGTTTQ